MMSTPDVHCVVYFFQPEDDDENPFGDDVGNNVMSFNDMDPSKMKGGKKADIPFS
jgi:hypothetical protein